MTATKKINLSDVPNWAECYRDLNALHSLQTVVFVMCGGGMLGRMAAEQPFDFYIDSRCGKLPYPKTAIMNAVSVLAEIAALNGLDPHNLPHQPDFPNCGVF